MTSDDKGGEDGKPSSTTPASTASTADGMVLNQSNVSDGVTNSNTGGVCVANKADEDDGAMASSACNSEVIHDMEMKEALSITDLSAIEVDESVGGKLDDGPKEMVEFKVIFNKVKYDVKFPLDETIMALKKHIEELTGVPSAMQKLVFKGMAKDDKSLRETGLANGAKIMVVGSTLTDVLAVNVPKAELVKDEKVNVAAAKESLCKQKIHQKVLSKGVPPDVMPAWRNEKSSLPPEPLYGMVNKSGGKVRLTFKLEADQLWLGTKERTEKIPMNTVRAVVSEAIEGHEEYHIMAIQLGPTEASRYWIYWVPAQYIHAIKSVILGP